MKTKTEQQIRDERFFEALRARLARQEQDLQARLYTLPSR